MLALVTVFFYMYFITYMTPSKTAWYKDMMSQVDRYFFEVTTIGR